MQIALEWLHECCMGYVWEEAGARNLVFFQVNVAAGDDERYLVCAAGAAGVVSVVPPMCFARMVAPGCVVLFGS